MSNILQYLESLIQDERKQADYYLEVYQEKHAIVRGLKLLIENMKSGRGDE